ncbi:MAG: ATP-binding protein, partial [Thermoanaerobaculales bacterium]|nr:ATP-binding protein [Thermoanaerobaculales bacterium]
GGLNHLDPSLHHARRYCADPSDPDRCAPDVIWDLHLDGAGVLWIAGAGLWRLDTTSGRIERHCRTGGLPEEGLSFIVEAPVGTLWLAGCDRRLYRYAVESRTLDGFDVSGEPSVEWVDPRIDSLLVRGHDLWLASGDWLCRFDLATGDFERVALEFARGAYLGSQGTWALHAGRDGSLWLGTSNGLLTYRPDRGEFAAWTTHDGLPGSAVYSILEDDDGRLWLGTNQGLSCFDLRLPAGRNFRNYTTADGIGNVEFNRHAAVETTDGRFIFGGMDGLTVFEPSRIRDNPVVPPVRITGIEVWNRDGTRGITPYGLERLVLSPHDSTFSFRFAALSFADPARNRYAYRLEGFEEGWVDAGARRTCQYTNISPGSYLFQVRGSNNDGLWNERGISLPVIIRPAFWQTWWFRTLSVVAAAAMALLAVGYRRARRREMQRLRLRIADDLHDDLSSDLSGIAVVTDMVQRKDSIDPTDRRDLVEVRDAALKMVDGVRDIVWYIDPEHDNLESLAFRMRHVAEVLLRGIRYRFDVSLPARSGTLSMAVRRSLLMVFKESLHNVVRHADAQNVQIELSSDGSRLRLRIADDGAGFDAEADPHEGHGLRSMQRRAAEIDARLDLDSEPAGGATVTMTLDMASSRDSGSVLKRIRLQEGKREV